MNTMNGDESILRDIDISGRLAPSSPSQRDQYYRLIGEGYLRRVPVTPMPDDTNDPLICEITERGRQQLFGADEIQP
jgi:hypothetical protein